MEQSQRGKSDVEFLERTFAQLSKNFTWWVNRMDRRGRNLFDGGFLGLDNISVFNRSAPPPTGGFLEQADGTAWMAMFCQNMLEIALELAKHESSYDDRVLEFAEHFLWIRAAMNKTGDDAMWDEDDHFYYDVLVRPDGTASRLKIRSMVGLLSLCATTVFEAGAESRVPRAAAALAERLRQNPELGDSIHPFEFGQPAGEKGRTIAALVNEERLGRILSRLLDEKEFLGDYGLRSLSRDHDHAANPFEFTVDGKEYVSYLPAESESGMFGGNSNWRGPIWFPVNFMIIHALNQFYLYYGDNFRVKCPTGTGNEMNLFEVAQEITTRLQRIFLRKGDRRPVFGGSKKFQTEHWRDHILFYEYFHGENGAGIGASHQTGWTGIISVLQRYGTLSADTVLDGTKSVFKA